MISPSKFEYLGRFSRNKTQPDSTSNPYGPFGSRASLKSIHNSCGPYGSRWSENGFANPVTRGGAKLYGNKGQFLGNLNSNRADPDSISNPYGRYGSKWSLLSVNNPYGVYGSLTSNQSANNPYATDAPVIRGCKQRKASSA